MADTGYVAAGSGINKDGVLIAWQTPGKITADDSVVAKVLLGVTQNSNWLKCYNFDVSSIPAGATIDGVAFRLTDYNHDSNNLADWRNRLNKADDTVAVALPSVHSADPTILPNTDISGDSSELWGETITYTNTQDTDFGLVVACNGGLGQTTQIDFVEERIWYSAESVVAGGTITEFDQDEQDIIDGGITILLDLTGVTWATAGATFDAQRQNIIDGIDSAQTETLGWNNEVQANMDVTRVVRTSDTTVTITLNAAECADYKITADELLSVTVPASAHSGAGILTDASFTTITALCDQTLAPDTIVETTNLTGAVTDIDESVDSPDGNWLVLA